MLLLFCAAKVLPFFESAKSFAQKVGSVVIWKGLEPLTRSLEGCCSNPTELPDHPLNSGDKDTNKWAQSQIFVWHNVIDDKNDGLLSVAESSEITVFTCFCLFSLDKWNVWVVDGV